MRVTVGFLGILRDQVGQKSVEIELPEGAGLGDLMDALAPLMEQKVGSWAWDNATHRFSPRVVVSRPGAPEDPARPLADGEEILVFPPLAGG